MVESWLSATDEASAVRVRARSASSRTWPLWIILVSISASGAHCPQVLQQYTQPVPRALPQTATLAQIIDVVNDNSARVQSFSTTKATISTPGYPSVSANINFQRPRSFRLLASTAILGPEVDMGSNDELLWFWIKRAQPPAMFFCRHDQFNASAARQVLPVEPEWLVEAFGVVTLDRASQIEGPYPVGKGRVELRSRSLAPGNPMSRITIIDDSRGVILEQHVYDGSRARIASAVMSKHVRDPDSGATLPRHVDIQWPPAQFELSIDMPNLQINGLTPDQRELFQKPTYSGYNEIDLAQPGILSPPPGATTQGKAPPQVRY